MDHYNLVAEWAKINAELEKAWEPYRAQVARRDEIEKQIPWLKGHGATPYPPKTLPTVVVPPKEGSFFANSPDSSSKEGTKIEGARTPGKSTRTEEKLKEKVDKLKNQPKSGKSPSTTPLSADSTQNFAGGKIN